MQLYPYQEVGRDFLKNRFDACLWDEPGLGKSFQSLAAMKDLGVRNSVIVCPASVRMVWKKECDKLNIDSHAVTTPRHIGSGVNILSYEGVNKCFDKLVTMKKDLVVKDEAHYLKGFNTRTVKNPQTGKNMKVPPLRVEQIFGRWCNKKGSIIENSEYNWSLTGTPMPNDPSELWPVLHTYFPDAIAKANGIPMGYWDFVFRYCKTVDNGFGLQIIGGKNLNDLRDRIRGRILRRKKADVLKDLPPIRYQMLPVEGNLRGVSPSEHELIEQALESDEPLQALKKLGTHIASLRKITGMAKVDSVIKWVKESGYDKIVLFAHHKAVIEKLRTLEGSVHVDGSCTQTQRESAVNRFQDGDARVFIGQIQAAGTGLTLTAANVLVFVECSYVPAENRQAADRIHRIGQDESCLIYLAVVPDSIDESIIETIERKMKTYDGMGL